LKKFTALVYFFTYFALTVTFFTDINAEFVDLQAWASVALQRHERHFAKSVYFSPIREKYQKNKRAKNEIQQRKVQKICKIGRKALTCAKKLLCGVLVRGTYLRCGGVAFSAFFFAWGKERGLITCRMREPDILCRTFDGARRF
jgi:hypothetical protein